MIRQTWRNLDRLRERLKLWLSTSTGFIPHNLNAQIDTPLASFVDHEELILSRYLAARREPSGKAVKAVPEGLRPSANLAINVGNRWFSFCRRTPVGMLKQRRENYFRHHG